MADEEEGDPVIEEVDVYLAKSLLENLHLFQYPTRPAAVTYDQTTCVAARVKPNQQKVMMEMSLNTNSPSYCTPKGEQFAYQVDDGVPDEKKFFESDKMDKQVLSSFQGTTSTSQYAVGVLKHGELHLTPLNGVIQLRPRFEYLDRVQEKKSTTNEEVDSQDEEDEKATALSVRFAKKESAYAKTQRLQSYKYLEKQMAEEQWTDVQYYGINNAKSKEEKDLLFCQEMNFEVLEFDPSPRNYIDILMPSSQPKDKRNSTLSTRPHTSSMADVRKLDLIDQVKTLLINAKVMSFSEICGLLYPAPTNELTVLKCVQQHAVLVQGCWAVKSELLYPKGKISAFSTATADTLCKGRDYILCKFTQSRSVQRKEIISVIKLAMDDVNDIIKQVANRNVAVGWEFKLPYDKDFVERFGDVAKQQHTFWEGKYRALCDKFNIQSQDEVCEDDSKTKNKVKPTVIHGMDELINHAMKMDVDLPNGFGEVTIKKEEKDELSPENQEKLFHRLAKFVKDKMNTSSLSLAEFKKLILLHQTAGSPGDIMSSGVSDALLLKAIDKCGGEEIDLKWPTASLYPTDLNSRRIFFIRAVDSPLDKPAMTYSDAIVAWSLLDGILAVEGREYRGIILDLFHGSFTVQRKTIMEKSREVLGSLPTTFEYNKLIQELGLERKGNSWYIRGTISTTTK